MAMSPTKTQSNENTSFLLHACCGPCSLEPIRILRDRGIEPVVFYSNSNIAPLEEYERRRDTIRDWCKMHDVSFIEDDYSPCEWKEATNGLLAQKPNRCRECYRIRFERSAKFAKENGFRGLGTTLTISPYQYTLTIKEELKKACEKEDINCFFEDYSTHYRAAQKRAKEEGLYRQNYCGCLPSKAEAEAEKKRTKAIKAKRQQEREEKLQKQREEKADYAKKRAKQREILKKMREERDAH